MQVAGFYITVNGHTRIANPKMTTLHMIQQRLVQAGHKITQGPLMCDMHFEQSPMEAATAGQLLTQIGYSG